MTSLVSLAATCDTKRCSTSARSIASRQISAVMFETDGDPFGRLSKFLVYASQSPAEQIPQKLSSRDKSPARCPRQFRTAYTSESGDNRSFMNCKSILKGSGRCLSISNCQNCRPGDRDDHQCFAGFVGKTSC